MRADCKDESQDLHGDSGEHERHSPARGGQQEERCNNNPPSCNQKKKCCQFHPVLPLESLSSIQFLSEQANLALRMGPIEIFNGL